MRASYYNVLVARPDGPGYLLYNTLHQSLAELSTAERACYEEVLCGDAREPEASERAFLEALAEGGFALEDPETEAAYLEYQYDLYKYNTRVLELTIAPTMDCNNSCVYCYETAKRPGAMSAEVQDAVFAYVEEKYADAPFVKLKVSWFGGEPLLQLGIIEALSKRFIGFCESRGVEYIAHIITNASLADADTARRLAACGVQSAMPSLDGIGQRHDCRRCSKSGKATYDTIRANISAMAAEDIMVNCSFLLDESNFADFNELGAQLHAEDNVLVRATQLRDYHSDLDADGSGIELTDRERYSREYFKFFEGRNPSREEVEAALAPLHVFCGTPLHNWWVIDELGGVYKCIGEIGDESRRIFNLLDPPETREVNWPVLLGYMNTSPAHDPLCRTCRVLPLCQGECAFERSVFSRNCRTFSYTIEDWVKYLWETICKEGACADEASEEAREAQV